MKQKQSVNDKTSQQPQEQLCGWAISVLNDSLTLTHYRNDLSYLFTDLMN